MRITLKSQEYHDGPKVLDPKVRLIKEVYGPPALERYQESDSLPSGEKRVAMATNTEKEKSITELIFELIDLSRQFLKIQVKDTTETMIFQPIKKLGFWFAFTIIAATLFALAGIFLAVGAFQLLATLVGAAWIAYFIIGGILLFGAVILLIFRANVGESRGK